MSSTLTVVGAVFYRDNEVLACRRGPHKAAAGKWEFPGGKVEPGEDPRAALARELHEELGMTHVEVGQLIAAETTVVHDQGIHLACYWVCADASPEASTDHDRFAWVPIAQLDALDWAEPDLPTVRAIERGGTPQSRSAGA